MPVVLRVVGEAAAGGQIGALTQAGTVIRIATGAPMPAGADAVVQVELTTPLEADGSPAGLRGQQAIGGLPASVAIHAGVPAGASIRRRGSDLTAGAWSWPRATRSGRPRSVLWRAPESARSPSTGGPASRSWLPATRCAAGSALGPSGIPDANGPGLRALAAAAGAQVIDLGIAQDRLDDVVARLRRGVAEADVVIVSGGVSVGPYDVVRAAFEAVGTVDLWRVAIQPGKPFAFGTARRSDGSPILLFGLPGNPVSSYVTFEIFVRPALRRLAGHA